MKVSNSPLCTTSPSLLNHNSTPHRARWESQFVQLQLKAGTALPNSAKDHKYGFVGSGGNYELLTVSCLVFLPNDRLGAGERLSFARFLCFGEKLRQLCWHSADKWVQEKLTGFAVIQLEV